MGLTDRWRTPAGRRAQRRTDDPGAGARPDRTVPAVVDDESAREHRARLTAAAEADAAAMTPEELDAALTARLVSAQWLESTGLGFRYAPRFADHVREVLTLDLPTAVVTLPDSRIAATGRRTGLLVDSGRASLQRLLETTAVDVERVGQGRSQAWVVSSASPYTASFARFLNDAVRRWLPEADTRAGAVFALPHRYAVIVRTCASADDVHAALQTVPPLARSMYDEDDVPLSEHTYRWLERQVTCLTRDDGEGGVALVSDAQETGTK